MENTQKTMAVILMGLCFTLAVASPTKPTTYEFPCDSTLEDQNLPHESACSKYYRCVYGKKVPKECPGEMLFNPSIGNCDMYYNVECPSSDEDVADVQSMEEAIENLTGRTFVRNPKVQVATTLETSLEKNEVATTNSESSTIRFVYVPHHIDQNAYYKIENGEKLLLHCDEGMVFSFELEICARPWVLQ